MLYIKKTLHHKAQIEYLFIIEVTPKLQFINTGKAGQKSAETCSNSKLKDASNTMGPGERKIF